MTPDFSIAHEEKLGRGVFHLEKDGKRVGELSYRRDTATTVTIDHTGVAVNLRGQGLARRLLDAAVEWARATHTKIVPACSYAAAHFSRDASIGDVLA
jgi:predicted GNAT family acetyltransferase